MSIKHDQIIVVDIEATCWKDKPPPGQSNEIIEVGVCLLDVKSHELSAKRSLLVRPTESEVSAFCTQLTTLTQEHVDAGVEFAAACQTLEKDYDSRNRLWASWGAYDRRMFLSQCKARGVRYPFSRKHANIKRVFADVYGKRVNMRQALDEAELELEGTHHRGHDDAWNIARLLVTMMQQRGEKILYKYW